MTYNHLNLPTRFEWTATKYIDITYDAAGVKLTKRKYDNGTVTVKHYVGGIEYDGTELEAVYHAEGRAIYNQFAEGAINNFVFEYSLKDHLGNSRVMFSDLDGNGQVTEQEIIQVEHYYPFGMKQEGHGNVIISETHYTYNGKELNADFGLDLHDYGARWYDASVGRWHGVDPLAEAFIVHSPYNYTFNNPIMFTDPDGRAPNGIIINSDGQKLGNDGKKDGKVYVVNSKVAKSRSKLKKMKKFIEENNGNEEAFKNEFDYSNVTEIESSSDTRQAMVDIVSADNGEGGTNDANNREYGGSIMKDGTVKPGEPGPVTTPKKGAEFSDYDGSEEEKTRFHSHPSGTITETEIAEPDPFGGDGALIGGGTTTTTTPYAQAPSQTDIDNAGEAVRYVFARGEGTVYMYNNTGVLATLPHDQFVNFIE